MAFIGLMAILTIVGNLTIMLVFTKNPQLRNSQAIFKITLAIGDIIVGSAVLPTFISTFYIFTVVPEKLGKETILLGNNSLPQYDAGPGSGDKISELYLQIVGFCTSFSLFVSVYSLTIASFDRLSAIMRPLVYNRGNAQSWAKVFCSCILVAGVIFASVPLFAPELKYGVGSFILVSLTGQSATIVYTITFLIPLVTVWVTTIVILVYSRKHARVRRSMSNKKDTFEKRLAITLAIMVLVFSGVVLPGVINMVVSMTVPNVFLTRPRELSQSSASAYHSFEFICVILLTSNSLWNIFIYSSMQVEFRKAVKRLYLSMFRFTSFQFMQNRSSLKRKPRSRRIVTRGKKVASSSKTTDTGSSFLANSSRAGATALRKCSIDSVDSIDDGKTNLRTYGGTMESILEAVETE